MSRIQFIRIAPAALLLLAAVALGTTVRAEDMRLVSDDVFTWGDLGGITIQHANCEGALDGRAIDGLDLPGEWIQWHLTLTEPSCFVDSLHSAGTTDVVREFVTEYISDPLWETAARDTVFTAPGSGVG
jgi:hypothetical protein